MIEVVIVGAILFFILIYSKKIDKDQFIKDSDVFIKMLKEDDYDFLVAAKYGESVEPDKLFQKRINSALLIFVVVLFVFLTNLNALN